MLMPSRLWISPGGPQTVEAFDEVDGSVAKSRLAAGTVLRLSHVKAPVLVRRNELVDVYCVQGGIEIVTKARAMAEGRRDDIVELKLTRDSRSFKGRVVSRGVVVMELPGAAGATK